MEYRNPLPAEGVNVGKTHPLKEFAWLAGAAVLLVVLGVSVFAFGGEFIAGRISFEQELAWSDAWDAADTTQPPEHRIIETELQALADRLAPHLPLAPGMAVTVHYVDEATVNAFATLGGHVVFFRGLLERIPHENALAMVMAHEIAHITERDPIRSLGRGMGAVLALSLVTGEGGGSELLGHAGMLTMLRFNRDQESRADALALKAVHGLYGHTQGATDLFRVFQALRDEWGGDWTPEFAATHPGDAGRIEALEHLAQDAGFAATGALTALPEALTELR